MRRGREYIGVPVKSVGRDAPVGQITDLVFTHQGSLKALTVFPNRGLFRRARTVPIEMFVDLHRSGGVFLESKDLSETHDSGGEIRLIANGAGLCGRRLVTHDGQEVGIVGDVVLDGRPAKVWGFEVSDGIIKDLLDGRSVIDARGAVVRGETIVLEDGPTPHMNLVDQGHATCGEGSE